MDHLKVEVGPMVDRFREALLCTHPDTHTQVKLNGAGLTPVYSFEGVTRLSTFSHASSRCNPAVQFIPST